MSSESAPSALTRLVSPLTIIALVAMIGGAIYHVSQIGAKPAPPFSRDAAPEAPDYSDATSWYKKPDNETSGGWHTPWGVDLFWYTASKKGYASGWNAPANWLSASSALGNDATELSFISEAHGVYAPARRFSTQLNGADIDRKASLALEAEDGLKSFDQYLAKDHRLRGVFIGGRGHGLELARQTYELRIKSTQPFDILFGGVIAADLDQKSLEEMFSGLKGCDDSPNFPCVLSLNGKSADASAKAVSELMTSFGKWLDDNAAKPAEPLPPIEIIEIEPINKPKGQ